MAVIRLAKQHLKRQDPKQAQRIVPDFIHPAPAGNRLPAGELLKTWNAPRVVRMVTLYAARKRVQEAVHTQVRNIDGRSWTQMDRALPFPAAPSDAMRALARHSSDFMERLNPQRLLVVGLPAGSYRLTIDRQIVGTFTFLRWREVDLPFSASAGKTGAASGLKQLEAELLRQARSDASPKLRQ